MNRLILDVAIYSRFLFYVYIMEKSNEKHLKNKEGVAHPLESSQHNIEILCELNKGELITIDEPENEENQENEDLSASDKEDTDEEEKNKIEDEYCGTSSQEWKVANAIVEGSFSRIGNYLWKRDRK